jgi:hypothetical protein
MRTPVIATSASARLAQEAAATIEGMIAKARCAKAYDEGCHPDSDDPLSVFAASIVRDLLASTRGRAQA